MRHVMFSKINWRKISPMMDDKEDVKVIFVPLSWSLKGMKNNEREFFHHCSSFTSNFLPLSGQNSLSLKYFQKIIKEDEKNLTWNHFFLWKRPFIFDFSFEKPSKITLNTNRLRWPSWLMRYCSILCVSCNSQA